MPTRAPRSLALLLTSALIAAPLVLLPAALAQADEELATTSESAITDDAAEEQSPAEEAPIADAPAEEAPAEEAPSEDAPAEDAPVEEEPAGDGSDTPATETPSAEAPADETTTPAPSEKQSKRATVAAAAVTAPTAPRNFRAVSQNGYTSFAWDAPADMGSAPLVNYRFEYADIDSDVWYVLENPTVTRSLIYTWAGLIDFRVSAITSAGQSAYASLDGVTERTQVSPGRPTNVVASASGSAIDLSWTAPASTGTAALASYTVRYRETSAVSWSTATVTTNSYRISGLQTDTTYVVQVRATSSVGSSRWTDAQNFTTLGVPSVVSDLDAVAFVGYVTLAWSAPASTGGTIEGYDVQYRTGTGSWTQYGRVEATDATITGLVAGTAYEFQVRAANTWGAAAWSSSASATLPAAPSVITDLQATRGDEEVDLEWSAPASNGSTITGYQLRYSANGISSTVDLDDVTSTTISGLENGVEYEFDIRASNDVGAGEWSDAETATPAGAPGVIADFVSTPIADGVTLSWAAPSDNGGSSVVGYELQYRLAGSTDAYVIVETTEPSTTITGLGNNVAYEVRVRVESEAGFGEWSDETTVTAGNVPSAPRDLTVRGADASIIVSWSAPEFEGGVDITDYEVTVVNAATNDVVSTTPVTGLSTTISGLTNSTLYLVSVHALNGRVVGTESVVYDVYAFTFTASFTNPDGSAITSVTPGDTVMISGSGSLPGAGVLVELHSDPISLGSTTVDASGAFSLSVTIPKGAPAGKHTLYAALGMGGGLISEIELPITVAAVASADTGNSLAITGIDQNSLFLALWFALGAAVLGTTLLVTRRRRASK